MWNSVCAISRSSSACPDILGSFWIPFYPIYLHGPTHNQLCVHWLMVESHGCGLTFINWNWNLKPQIQAIWKATVKVIIITANWKKGGWGKTGTLISKYYSCSTNGYISAGQWVGDFGWRAHVDVLPSEPWTAGSVRAVIYIALTFHHKANLDFPKESIHKHLSNFKLQARLDRVTKSMSSYYCDSEAILQGPALPTPKDRRGPGLCSCAAHPASTGRPPGGLAPVQGLWRTEAPRATLLNWNLSHILLSHLYKSYAFSL